MVARACQTFDKSNQSETTEFDSKNELMWNSSVETREPELRKLKIR